MPISFSQIRCPSCNEKGTDNPFHPDNRTSDPEFDMFGGR
jgi:hypothetical protein